MEALVFLLFVAALAATIVAIVYSNQVRDLRLRVAQLQTSLAGMGQQLHGTHYHLQTEAGGRQAAQQQAAELARQADTARYQAQAAQRVAFTVAQQVEAAQRDAERASKEAGKNLEKATKSAADAQKRGQQVADRYVNDTAKRAESDMTSSNFETIRTRVDKAISFCSAKGFPVAAERDAEISQLLRTAFEDAIRKEAAREEQRRIKEQIRDEQRAERERQKEVERLDADEKRIERALAEAEAKAAASASATKGMYDAEVERLKQMLSDAEARAQRAKSQAQLTKAGFVYVISNIGSFGEGMFKVGMTRRLEPMDRVVELGDASVPFPFDVHLMVSCLDAPALESALHRELNPQRVNKVNLRKEFFRLQLDQIVAIVQRHHGKVEYRAEPEALEYRETKLMEQRGMAPVYDPVRDEENEDAPAATAQEIDASA